MKLRTRANIQALAVAALTLTLASAGCKKPDECQKAIDHLAHLSYLEGVKALDGVAPEMRAEAAKMMPSEEMMLAKMREIGAKRFGARCHDPAFAKCVIAAPDPYAIARCEHPDPSP